MLGTDFRYLNNRIEYWMSSLKKLVAIKEITVLYWLIFSIFLDNNSYYIRE